MISSLTTDCKANPTTLTSTAVDVQPNIKALSVDNVKWRRARCWITALVILGLAFIAATILFTYMTLWKRPEAPVVYTFVLHDKSTDSNINVESKDDPSNNIDFFTSPEVDKDGKIVGQVNGIRDRNTGVEAYTATDADLCLIFISPDDDNSNYGTYSNGSVNERDVEGISMYRLLNETIDPYVLKSVAGNYIVEFCANRMAVWMIPVDNTDDQSPTKRVRRFGGGWNNWNNNGYYWRCWYKCGFRGCFRSCRYSY